ncbi:30S ribosomal protein S8 [Candidatus Saccharibacteria bacterium RIFCSPHIGHO2_12_FULL_47_16b]|nr:MAG: 30S ribosomal protein S8 [Candidatus Saccharibacteria bacterium RIFCSPHIGHO2_12_FULL_47_16b]OGL39373.1 MAG: 30S ribosomal protein S8 [Candidatus Saccharibacteria bacterium RIFCSPLOWO2_02_FULL_46_7]
MTDPIADMLARIRNALATGKNEVNLPHSKIKHDVAQVLVQSGFLASVKANQVDDRKELQILLYGLDQSPLITELKRVSRPGRRHYVKASEIPSIKAGRGIVVLSTSQGIMSGLAARKKGIGGELICEVY